MFCFFQKIMRGDRNGIEVKTGDQIDVMIMSVTPVKGSVLLSWAEGGSLDGQTANGQARSKPPKGQLSRRRMKKPPRKKKSGAKKLSKQRQKS